jgi:hypothetical protein
MIFFFYLLTSLPTQAAGVISIKGTLQEPCTTSICKIKMGPQLYVVETIHLAKSQLMRLRAKKVGDLLTESIPMSSIKDVTDIK